MTAARAGRKFKVSAVPLVLACVAAGLVIAAAPRGASAVEALSNPGFETWVGATPTGWSFNGGSFSKAAGEWSSGNAVRVTVGDDATWMSHQAIEVEPGAWLVGTVQASGPPSGSASVGVLFLDSESKPIILVSSSPMATSAGFITISLSATAPAGAKWVKFVVLFGGSGAEILVDNASLTITGPPSTATPTPEPTATSTPEPTATPTANSVGGTATPAGDTPTPGTGGPTTATPVPGTSATPTRTHTPTRTPTGTRTPSPTNAPTSTKTPTPSTGATAKPTNPLATSTPTVKPGSGFGGMLANGDFEIVTDGKPAYWEKFGGTMLAEGGAVRGSYAGCLHSETASTKWLYQVIQVDEGDWYEATAFGRVAGPGAVSIRVSWYASSDGSGSQMDQAESNVSSGSGWANLATGAIQAPIGSNSARVRLVLRPDGSATGCFDDARFDGTEPAPVAARATAVPGSPDQPAATQPNANRPAIGATERPVGPGPNVAPLPVLTFAAGGPGAIRISEIMSDPDPAGRDAAYEWVELVNISAEPVDLAGWKLGDGSEQQTLSAFVVPASGYVVIGGASAILRAGVVVLASPGGEVGNGLGNDGDQVILIAPNGEVADEMSYGTNTKIFDPAPKAPGKGATIGVRDPAADPASENWGLTLRPTPGEPNAFPAPAKSTVVGGKTANPGVDDSDGSRVESASGGGPGAPWMVLMGAAGISAGVIGVKYGPRLRAVIKRR